MSGNLISKNNFSSSTLEAFKKIDKSQYGNQDSNISIGELKKSITDEKGNISKEKLNSLGITNQKDIDIISKEYKAHKSEPNKFVFTKSEINSVKVIRKDNLNSLTFLSESIKLDRSIVDKYPNLVKDLNSIRHNFININQADLQKKLKGYINIVNSDKEQKINLEIFNGRNKGTISILKNKNDEKKLSDDYAQVVKSFKGIKNIDISSNISFHDKVEHGKNYFRVEGSNRVSYGITNELALNSKKEESLFRSTLLNSKKSNLTPVDLIKSALEITKGDYQKATLIVHNTLKSITYDLRDANKDKDNLNLFFTKNARNYKIIGKERFTEDIKIVGKLSNLRAEGKSNDKMGVWYHFFGVQLACSTQWASFTNTELTMEHLARKGYPLTSISPTDSEKSNIDNLSYNTFKKISK